MKRFEFPLESVLRLRRFAEAEARQALQEAVAALADAEAELAATQQAIAAQTAELQRRLTDMLPAEVVNAWHRLDALEALALKQQARVAECEAEVAHKRDAYLAAQRERKPLERLKEELHKTHLHDADLADQAVLDELAVIGHVRKAGDP